MKWIKWYPQIWLHSTCQQDLEPAERAAWLNFVCLAAMREPQGQFRFATLEALAQQLLIPKEIIKSALDKCLKAGRIEIEKNLIETIVTITKWGLYQPSYDQFTRKAVYKKPEKEGKSVNAFTKNPTRIEEKRIEEKRKDKNTAYAGGVSDEEIASEFKDLWDDWPVKKDKDQAFINYRRERKTHTIEELEKAVDGYEAFLKSQRLKKGFDQQPLYLSTFLNKNRWKEYLDEQYSPSL
jgi:hypothetical protein